MIIPTRYMSLDYSLLSITAMIINEFKIQSIISYDDLINIINLKTGESGKEIVPYSLNYLFLLGKIEYYSEIDSFEIQL